MIIGKTTNSTAFFGRDEKNICLHTKMVNRHGIISGATGSGKTVSMRVVIEELSKAGIPALVTDIKGDVSTIAEKGVLDGDKRPVGWKGKTFHTQFFDVFGKKGTQIQTSIAELGAMLLAKMFDLNTTQASALSVVFDVAADWNKTLETLDNVLAVLRYLGSFAYKNDQKFGSVAPNTLGVLQRKIHELKRNGGDAFFNTSSFSLENLMKVKRDEGVINILHSVELVKYPTIYATFLIWLLTKFYDELPEVGNLDKPKFVFFIDEAHLLFNSIEKRLLEKLQQTIRLIRSKGVGVFLVTQTPTDIPDAILGQLGNKIQHSLLAYSPRELSKLKAIAGSFRQNPMFDAYKEISNLEVGEALVSFLDEHGKPQPVEKVKIRLPQSNIS